MQKRSDWKAPKGDVLRKWRSKVNHRIITRIDLSEADEDEIAMAGADEEVENDLKKE